MESTPPSEQLRAGSAGSPPGLPSRSWPSPPGWPSTSGGTPWRRRGSGNACG